MGEDVEGALDEQSGRLNVFDCGLVVARDNCALRRLDRLDSPSRIMPLHLSRGGWNGGEISNGVLVPI